MDANQDISARPPQEYFEKISTEHPGALESQWIPMDRDLWRVENYPEFLAARRELLADAANRFLDGLLHGEVPEKPEEHTTRRTVGDIVTGTDAGDEEDQIIECMEWLEERSLPQPELRYRLEDEVSGEELTVLDMAWPNGLQQGFSEPVAVLLNEPPEVEEAARKARYRFFRTVGEFKTYVLSEILAEKEVA